MAEIIILCSSSLASFISSRRGALRAVITCPHVGWGVLSYHFCSTFLRHSCTSLESALMVASSSGLRPNWIPMEFHLAALGRRLVSKSQKSIATGVTLSICCHYFVHTCPIIIIVISVLTTVPPTHFPPKTN